MYGQQRPGRHFAHVQDDLNLRILHMFAWRGIFLCVYVEVLRPSQPNGFMSSMVSLLNHMFTTVLSTSLGKTFFAWRFILNENSLFWLTISCQKPFVFYVSVFCSQIFTQKLKLWPKVGLPYAISIVK